MDKPAEISIQKDIFRVNFRSEITLEIEDDVIELIKKHSGKDTSFILLDFTRVERFNTDFKKTIEFMKEYAVLQDSKVAIHNASDEISEKIISLDADIFTQASIDCGNIFSFTRLSDSPAGEKLEQPLCGKLFFQIRSLYINVRFFCVSARNFCDMHGMNHEIVSNIELCLAELCNNIIAHGYGEECDKTINIYITIENEELEVVLSDEAPVFDTEKNLDFAKDVKPAHEIPHGRGLFIIANCLDSYSYFRSIDKNITVLKKKFDACPEN